MKTIGHILSAYRASRQQAGCKGQSIASVLKDLAVRLGDKPVSSLCTQDIEQMVAAMQAEGYKPSTTQGRVSYLRAAMRYGQRCGLVNSLPYFPSLKFHNARQGFFEADEFERIVCRLSPPFDDVARFGYETGWRLSEILGLRWSQVDRQHGVIALPDSKNGQGRTLPLRNGRAEIIDRQWQGRPYGDALSQWVFHIRGQRITRDRFWRTWKVAREAAGLPNKLFHDFRRTAARDMVAAGVDYHTAMQVTGHRTMSMFLRYQITDMRSMVRGLDALDRHRAA